MTILLPVAFAKFQAEQARDYLNRMLEQPSRSGQSRYQVESGGIDGHDGQCALAGR